MVKQISADRRKIYVQYTAGRSRVVGGDDDIKIKDRRDHLQCMDLTILTSTSTSVLLLVVVVSNVTVLQRWSVFFLEIVSVRFRIFS